MEKIDYEELYTLQDRVLDIVFSSEHQFYLIGGTLMILIFLPIVMIDLVLTPKRSENGAIEKITQYEILNGGDKDKVEKILKLKQSLRTDLGIPKDEEQLKND